MHAMHRAFVALAALPGLLLLALAAAANPAWIDRHVVSVEYFQPPLRFFYPTLRIVVALAGGLILFAARKATPGGVLRITLALLLALLTGEGILRLLDKPDIQAPHPRLESRLGNDDARLGWVLTPHRTTTVAGVRYAVDAFGDRARDEDFREDPDAPTVILAGESVAYGHGLAWEDTIAAQLSKLMHVQVVVTAVGGYGNDQAYLRAMDALARLHNVIAIVTVVLPVQLSRNLHDYRPRLALENGQLVARPAVKQWQLRNLFFNEFRFTSERSLQRSLALTRAIFAATPRALLVEPLFDRDQPPVMQSLLEGFPHVVVRLGREQILPGDGHPNASGASTLARAIANALG